MRIAVVGGTGSVGKPAAHELAERGHDVRVLSRRSTSWPVDLRTGSGLDAALEGVVVVVDASNATKDARSLLVEGGRMLLEAERRAGVGHHVCLSIVGIDGMPGYYRVKCEQEEVVKGGPIPWTIVRATQFHTLIDYFLTTMARRARIVPVASARFQPADPREVGAFVADAAEAAPERSTWSVAGPEVATLRALAGSWRRHHPERRVAEIPLPLALAGRVGRALRDGKLTDPAAPRKGTVTFEEWLARRA